MRVTWETQDVIPGRVVAPNNGANERWMVGYDPLVMDDRRWVLVSLADGMVMQPQDRQGLADRLTAGNYIPNEVVKPRTGWELP